MKKNNDRNKKKFEIEYEKIIEISKTLFEQTKESKKKIYSVHEPMVDCICKGKVHKKYEFGTKVR